MAYVIEKFGAAYATATELPTLGGRQPQGSALIESSLIKLPGGGSFDWRGSERLRLPEQEVILEGVWVAANVAGMETKLSALKKLVGVRDKLWRNNGSAQHWRVARLLEVESVLEPGAANTAEIRLRFMLNPGPWQGSTRSVTASLDASPKKLTCINSGDATVTDPIVTVKAAGSTITALTVDIYGAAQLNWTGSLTAGATLTIDCGLRSVVIGAADAYAGFSLSTDWHKINDWLRLSPGATDIHITKSGGSSASEGKVAFNDGWV